MSLKDRNGVWDPEVTLQSHEQSLGQSLGHQKAGSLCWCTSPTILPLSLLVQLLTWMTCQFRGYLHNTPQYPLHL